MMKIINITNLSTLFHQYKHLISNHIILMFSLLSQYWGTNNRLSEIIKNTVSIIFISIKLEKSFTKNKFKIVCNFHTKHSFRKSFDDLCKLNVVKATMVLKYQIL